MILNPVAHPFSPADKFYMDVRENSLRYIVFLENKYISVTVFTEKHQIFEKVRLAFYGKFSPKI